jgi:hypothetical protein
MRKVCLLRLPRAELSGSAEDRAHILFRSNFEIE